LQSLEVKGGRCSVASRGIGVLPSGIYGSARRKRTENKIENARREKCPRCESKVDPSGGEKNHGERPTRFLAFFQFPHSLYWNGGKVIDARRQRGRKSNRKGRN